MIIFVSVDNKSISNMSKFTSILTAATVLVMAASCSTQKIAVTAHRGYWKCEGARIMGIGIRCSYDKRLRAAGPSRSGHRRG